MKTIIVGAGIIGSAIAFQMSRAGAQVVVIDAGLPAATDNSFGWINASFYADAAHHRLRAASIDAYGRLLTQIPKLPVQMAGALCFEDQGAVLDKMQSDLATLGYPVERLKHAQAKALEGDVSGFPTEILRFPSEGAAEVSACAAALMAASGAHVISGVRVTGVLHDDGTVCGVQTDTQQIEGTNVIVAAGTGAPDILASVGVELPMLTRPGALVTTKQIAAKINHVLVTPHGEVRQMPDGRLLASAVANHQGDASSDVTETDDEISARVLAWLDPMIKGDPLEADKVAVALRPVPEDGLPVIGQVGPKGLHVAVMHSGVTLAAIVGEAVAAEVMGNTQIYADLLAPYRPARFQ